MASSRKKRRGLSIAVIVVLCLLLIAVVAAAVGYSLVARRVKALQAGASFTLDYEITPPPTPLPFTASCSRPGPPTARSPASMRRTLCS